MNHILILLLFLTIGFLVCFCIGIRQTPSYLFLLTLRGFLGSIFISSVNFLLSVQHLSSHIGLNLITISTAALLGFPGLLLLYSLSLYFHFFA